MTEELLQATVSVRGVVITPREETLVVQRSSDGEWELPGGRLAQEEDVVPGLKREMDEETTLDIEVEDVVHANAWRNGDDDGRFAVYYRCRTDDRDVRLSEEHVDYRWVPYAEAGRLLPEPQAAAVRRGRPETEAEVTTQLPLSATSD
jgi:8-oxo-dGTP pyrophosphatase MutT (NUDIX family)